MTRRKNRLLPPTPEQIRQRREAREMAELQREADKRQRQRTPEGFGMNRNQLGGEAIRDGSGAVVGVTQPLQAFATLTIRRDQKGRPTGAWKTTPFKTLADKGTLSQSQANAGHHMMQIYAASKDMDGAPENHLRVDCGDADAWGREDRKQYFIRLWGEIIGRMSRSSGAVAQGLALAYVEHDRPAGWVEIVRHALGRETLDDKRASERVVMVCEELDTAIPGAQAFLRSIR